jgi:predicted nicotinamide N-methyase
LWDSAPGVARWLLAEHAQRRLARCRALDLGCGMGLTGTVAAMLGAHVTFADLETPALLFARLNSLPWRSRIRTRQLNWRVDRIKERFDLILGADILYEVRQWEYQEPFWREHLAPGGRIALGEPGRASGDQFIDWIQRRRWRLTRLKLPVHTRPHATPIRLFLLDDPR